jgi:hypothetical protein
VGNPKPVITILLDEQNRVFVTAPVDKRFCFNLLSEAIKIIANTEEKKSLIQPATIIPLGGNHG